MEEIIEILSVIKSNTDEENAKKMSAYMKDGFRFAGIPKPKLKELIKPFLTKTAKSPLDWEFVFGLWDTDFREAQYVALEYLGKHHRQLTPDDIDFLKKLITEKSWWETVDTIDAFVGEIVLKDESLKETMLEWAVDENIWLRRVAIDFQQEYKDKTDTVLLEKIISLNLGTNEFFINKAIGWSLRDYSKVNPEWVSAFVEKYRPQMANLSIKEATKYI